MAMPASNRYVTAFSATGPIASPPNDLIDRPYRTIMVSPLQRL
jgi:hypothetical protein